MAAPITLYNIRKQYESNVRGLRSMLDKARASASGKYNGYTVAELEAKVREYEGYARMSDAEISAHIAAVRERVAKRSR